MKDTVHLAVSGATGRVARSLLSRIAAGALFGPERRVALSLLDIPEVLPTLKALATEWQGSPHPLLAEVRYSVDPRHAFEGMDWVVLLGARRWQPGLSKAAWARLNESVFVAQSRAINAVAPSARVLVGVHPSNVHCMVARAHAQDVPPEHWFALTKHAELCASDLIARQAGVPPSQVNRLSVWGNDGAGIFVDIRNAWVDGQPAPGTIDEDWMHSVFEPSLARRMIDLIETRGDAPDVAAQAIAQTIRGLTTPTPYRRWLCAGVVSDGSYEVDRGLVFSFPIRTEDGRTWSIMQDFFLDTRAQERIAANVAELSLEAVGMAAMVG